MASATTESAPEVGTPGRLPQVVDWLVGLFIAIAGLVALVGGSILRFAIDRAVLLDHAEWDSGPVEVMSTQLTRPEVVDVAMAVLFWTGIGLIVTGVGMLLFAAWYVASRHRSHSRSETETPERSFGAFAVTGAVVTVLVSFVPFSSAVGGGVAGYLERAESTRTASVGALSGVLHVVPFAVIVLFVMIGVWVGFQAVGETGIAVLTNGVILLAFVVSAGVSIGLAALGGFLGGRLAE